MTRANLIAWMMPAMAIGFLALIGVLGSGLPTILEGQARDASSTGSPTPESRPSSAEPTWIREASPLGSERSSRPASSLGEKEENRIENRGKVPSLRKNHSLRKDQGARELQILAADPNDQALLVPVVGSRVELWRSYREHGEPLEVITSDAEGQVKFHLPPRASYIIIRANGLETKSFATFRLPQDRVILGSGGALRGRVVESHSGYPLANIVVRGFSSEDLFKSFREVLTDSSGHFCFDGVCKQGYIDLHLFDEDYAMTRRLGLRVHPDPNFVLEIEMEKGARVKGQVLDSEGRPLEDLLVELRSELARVDTSTFVDSTDEGGRFAFCEIPSGDWELRVGLEQEENFDGKVPAVRLSLASGEFLDDVRIKYHSDPRRDLDREGEIKVSVVDESGNSLADKDGLSVLFMDMDLASTWDVSFDASYESPFFLPVGRYEVHASCPGFSLIKSAVVHVTEGDIQRPVLSMRPIRPLFGVVVGPDGSPLARAMLSHQVVMIDDLTLVRGATDSSGFFRLDVCGHQGWLSVAHPDLVLGYRIEAHSDQGVHVYRLPHAGVLEARVVDRRNRSLPNLWVKIFRINEEHKWMRTRTGPDGVFSFRVAPGEYVLSISECRIPCRALEQRTTRLDPIKVAVGASDKPK